VNKAVPETNACTIVSACWQYDVKDLEQWSREPVGLRSKCTSVRRVRKKECVDGTQHKMKDRNEALLCYAFELLTL